jgi:ABC-type transport system involved in cytochrome bd biosynthesis fused ATPase/permease subunit
MEQAPPRSQHRSPSARRRGDPGWSGYLQETAAERSAAQVEVAAAVGGAERAVLTARRMRLHQSRELATLVTRGVDALDGYFARFLPQLVLAVVIPVVVLVQIAVVDWVSGLLIAVTLPLIPVFMVLVGLGTRAAPPTASGTSLALLGGHSRRRGRTGHAEGLRLREGADRDDPRGG